MINVEEFHAHCLNEIVSFSKKYMEELYGKEKCFGLLIKASDMDDSVDFFDEDEEFSCDIIGKIKLPHGTDKLINQMALFCRATLSHITKVNNTSWTSLPKNTYALNSLLQSGFPKNVKTGVFKAHDGALSIGEIDEPSDFRAIHVAFSGIGIILMNETRKILSPMSPDSEVVDMAEELFLSISNEEPS